MSVAAAAEVKAGAVEIRRGLESLNPFIFDAGLERSFEHIGGMGVFMSSSVAAYIAGQEPTSSARRSRSHSPLTADCHP